jgi:predicted transcriptional regulator
MKSTTFTVRVDTNVKKRLERLAKSTGRSRSFLAAEAINEYEPAVELLAAALRARGINAWLDRWEIKAGDDIVASIDQGLDQADAGLVAFSQHSQESRWVASRCMDAGRTRPPAW